MKRPHIVCRSYCQLRRQWTRLSTPLHKLTSENKNVRHKVAPCSNFLASVSHHKLTWRHYCTKTADEEILEEDEDPELLIPTIPVSREKTNIEAKFRTEHNDPTKHTIEDEGLFYKVSSEDYKKFIQEGQWHYYRKQVKTFTESVIMVRRPALEAFDIIDHLNLEYPPVKLFFYGKNGSGKTMTLAHIVHRYSSKGWLIVHVPSMADLIRHTHVRERPHSLSTFKEGRYDYTDDAAKWLTYFKEQNRHLLEDFKTSKDYIWSLREKHQEGSEILEIIDFGIERKKYASDCIGVLLKEIKLKAAANRFKVLVAVDGVNGFWKKTNVKDENRQLVPALNISMINHFWKLFLTNWNNGVCVGTVCACVSALDEKTDRDKIPYTPQFLLKKEGFEFMDPFIPILVPDYNMKEAYNCLYYYIERKWITKPRALTREGMKELLMISNNNPYQLMRISGSW